MRDAERGGSGFPYFGREERRNAVWGVSVDRGNTSSAAEQLTVQLFDMRRVAGSSESHSHCGSLRQWVSLVCSAEFYWKLNDILLQKKP